MSTPPFKLASVVASLPAVHSMVDCCDGPDGAAADPTAAGRSRLGEMQMHLHCSIIGTCLGTAELRKLMAKFIDVHGASDLDVHHEAVRLAGDGGAVTKALNKALDMRHGPTVMRYGRARSEADLAALWSAAMRQGEIPGAYWAVLTHRHAGGELRQQVFGDVHMLSHLVGASNRADIRKLVALERDNDELRERLDRQQARLQEMVDERDGLAARLVHLSGELAASRSREEAASARRRPDDEAPQGLVALHTERRERAGQAAASAVAEASRLVEERDHQQRHAAALGQELAAAELQLRELSATGDEGGPDRKLEPLLRGKRILYVGGRPSSTPAIRDLVARHGGEIQRHDGGFEDRKGMLGAAVSWADLVVFPVDCIDHDSAGNLKRQCGKASVPYLPLRTASVASFAAGLLQSSPEASRRPDLPGAFCIRHG